MNRIAFISIILLASSALAQPPEPSDPLIGQYPEIVERNEAVDGTRPLPNGHSYEKRRGPNGEAIYTYSFLASDGLFVLLKSLVNRITELEARVDELESQGRAPSR